MFARIKNQRNKDGSVRQYLEIVENRRVDGKVRQRVLANLGRLDRAQEGQIDALIGSLAKFSIRRALFDAAPDALSAQWSRDYGPVLVFRRLWEDLGLNGTLAKLLEGSKIQHDVEEATFAMVLNRLMDPESKLGVSRWVDKVFRPEFESLGPQHFYRSLDVLARNKRLVEEALFARVRSLFDLELDVVFYDTTSTYVHGTQARLAEFGYSRDKRPDLRQVTVGILMTRDGMPVGHQVFPGNFADVECFLAALADLRCRYKLGRVVMVADRGMVSKTTLAALDNDGYQYIVGARMRRLKGAQRALAEPGPYQRVNDRLEVRESVSGDRRYIVCHNPGQERRDRQTREQIVAKLREKLAAGTVTGLVGNSGYRRYLRLSDTKGTIDEAKVESEALYDGKYVLMTNTDLPAAEVALAYKDLWQVERAFRDLKSNLDLRPIYHWTTRRIRGHIMVCFLAFALEKLLVRRLKESHPELEYPQVRADLDQLKMLKLSVNGRGYLLRTELQGNAYALFRAVGSCPPPRVTELEPPKSAQM